MQSISCRVVDCVLNCPLDNNLRSRHIAGHKTKVWILNHGGPEDGFATLPGGLHLARSYFFGESYGGPDLSPEFPRGHFTLRYYTEEGHEDGHFGLEMFDASDTVPFALADAMMWVTQDAIQWFFDPEKMISDPLPYRRQISQEEITERLRGYQYYIDVETRRDYNRTVLPLPSLTELPEEIQRRLVQHWDRLWWDWLDLHPDYCWIPMLGFWHADEMIFYLQGPTAPVRLGRDVD
jgi:hypothetical protein